MALAIPWSILCVDNGMIYFEDLFVVVVVAAYLIAVEEMLC